MANQPLASTPINWAPGLRLRYAIAFCVVSSFVMASAWVNRQQGRSFEQFLNAVKSFEADDGKSQGASDGQQIILRLTVDRLAELEAWTNWLMGLTIASTLVAFIVIFEPMATLLNRINAQREEALRESQEASLHKSQFLANMSHEIRTPMNGIIGMAALLASTELQPDQRDHLTLIRKSADSLLSLLNDILDFSKIEAGKLELESTSFRLRDCIESTARILAVSASEKGLELACRISSEVPDVLIGDPMRLRQVIANLLSNAIKFTHSGEVVVDVECSGNVLFRDEIAETIRNEHRGIVLQFSVWDTGIGIPAEKQKLIFDAFSQADVSTTRNFGGTGLGLTISSQLVQMMKGTIHVESELGKGSRFWFTAEFGIGQNVASLDDSSLQNLRDMPVLIVDDNLTNRLILKEICVAWSMQPLLADNVTSAISMLEDTNHRIPLILTDSMMPDLDGFVLANHVRKRWSSADCKIIMLSSSMQPGDADRCEKLQIARCIAKPFSQSELLDAILSQFVDERKSTASSLVEGRTDHPRLILLAEDNRVNQIVAVEYLRRRGHKVVVVEDGAKAIDAIRQMRFDLVLMDVQMPIMDGLSATKSIRDAERNGGTRIPIFAMTANAMTEDRDTCIEAGMDGHITKPINPTELFSKVESVPASGLAESFEASQLNALVPGLSDKSKLTITQEPTEGDSVPSDSDPKNSPVPWENIIQKYHGNLDFIRQIASILISQVPALTKGIADAYAEQDAKTVHRLAHTLKGSLQTFHVVSATDLAQQIESFASRGELANIGPLIPTLQAKVVQVVAEVSRFLNGEPSS